MSAMSKKKKNKVHFKTFSFLFNGSIIHTQGFFFFIGRLSVSPGPAFNRALNALTAVDLIKLTLSFSSSSFLKRFFHPSLLLQTPMKGGFTQGRMKLQQ